MFFFAKKESKEKKKFLLKKGLRLGKGLRLVYKTEAKRRVGFVLSLYGTVPSKLF